MRLLAKVFSWLKKLLKKEQPVQAVNFFIIINLISKD